MLNALARLGDRDLCHAASGPGVLQPVVPMQTDGPHYYQTSTPLWVEIQTGINRGKKERVLGSARCQHTAQLSTYAIQIHKPACHDRPVLDQVHLYLFTALLGGSGE